MNQIEPSAAWLDLPRVILQRAAEQETDGGLKQCKHTMNGITIAKHALYSQVQSAN